MAGGSHGGVGGGHGLGGRRTRFFRGGHAFSGFVVHGFSPDSQGREYFPQVDFLFAEMTVVSGITTLGTMGISEIRTYERRHFFNDFDFVGFGFPDWWYPDYGYVDYGYAGEDADNDSPKAYGGQYWEDLAMKVQSALSRRGYYDGPIDGVVGPDGAAQFERSKRHRGCPRPDGLTPTY